jgi:exopolyphosphatase/guanosine-5'-triphosphate,3'-diphosphate pyrophosphatase
VVEEASQASPSPGGHAPIVPRWEWRTFGARFEGTAESHFASLQAERVQDSDELYLLSTETSKSVVKVRAGLLDVKHLEQVNDEGLEQWRPVLKAGFPVAVTDVGSVFERLSVSDVSLSRPAYSMDELVDELVRPSGQLSAVHVHKRRERYELGGCMAELTEVKAEGKATRTIAIESDDPARVIATVRELGLALRPNVSYPRGLKALLGLGATRYAVIDVGTNSVKFHIGERSSDGKWRAVVDRAEVTRLGEGLDQTGELGETPMQRTIDAIADMTEEATQNEVAGIAAVGTAGLRAAHNSAALVAAVLERCGVEIEIISADEEARLAYLAATSALDLGDGSLVVFDTGGGSSQFTFGRGEHVEERFSLEVGAVRIAERFVLGGTVTDVKLAEALESVSAELGRLDGRPTPDALVGMGGAVTNLAAVKLELGSYDPDLVQGTTLDLPEIDRQIKLYRTSTVEERRRIVGLQPKRAEVILAGACIVRTVLAKLGCRSLAVSDRGLRHGLLVERFRTGAEET